MKHLNKVLLFIAVFLFLAIPAQAKGIFTPVLTGTVTNANMTITLADGSADIDFASATVPRNYQGHLLKVCDSTLKCVQGYVYTDGAGNVQNIVSAKGGTTRNWISDSGINTDDAAGYTYTLLKSNQSVVVASGSIAQADNRGDYTATNAFYWANGLDMSAYQDGRHFLTIYDSGGLGSGGFISATAPVGDGGGNELLGGELLSNPSFDVNVSSWNIYNGSGASIPGGQSNNCFELTSNGAGSGPYATQVVGVSTNQLILISRYLKSGNSGVQVGLAYYSSSNIAASGSSTEAWVLSPRYATATASNGIFYLFALNMKTNGQTILFDEPSLQQVTDPPPTGVRIVSTKGGATRNWTWKNASFNPNTAATYKIYYLGD